MFEVILNNGDRAEADSEAGILLAARLLIQEAAQAAGAARILRKDVIVTQAETYNSRLTNAARTGATCLT